MGRFEGPFSHLAKEDFCTWAPAIDWLLSNNHFEKRKWDAYISTFTKKIKKIDGIKGIDIKHGKQGAISFPGKRPNGCRIIIEQYDEDSKSVGKDLVRHIRNGIAHGRAKFVNLSGEKSKEKGYVEIKDYRDNSQKYQTAYILIPKNSIKKIYDIFAEIDKRI